MLLGDRRGGAGGRATGRGPRAARRDDAITHANAAAEGWLEELGERAGEPLPHVRRRGEPGARRSRTGRSPKATIARRAGPGPRPGGWALVRGSALGDEQTAVLVEPARPHELAPLVADAYGLTERERAVTAAGRSRAADRRHRARGCTSPPWTVQDHFKAIFEKVDVGTPRRARRAACSSSRGPSPPARDVLRGQHAVPDPLDGVDDRVRGRAVGSSIHHGPATPGPCSQLGQRLELARAGAARR